MRAFVVAAVVAGTGLLASSPAAAECAARRAALFPTDDELPPDPVVYRFDSHLDAAALRIDGPNGPVPFVVRDVSSTEDVPVTEIRIHATSGPITIHLGEHEAYQYEVRAQPAPAVPVVLSATREDYAWSSSHSDGLAIEFWAPHVAAFEARWADGTTALVSPDEQHGWPDGRTRSVVFLGYASCVGDQIPPDHIGRRDVMLYAVYADGRRRIVDLTPATLSAAIALVVPVADGGLVLDSPTVPALRGLPSLWPRPAVLGLALGALTVGLGLTWRRRRRRAAAISL